jgi:hypothetical protein
MASSKVRKKIGQTHQNPQITPVHQQQSEIDYFESLSQIKFINETKKWDGDSGR